jgi:hypothetical protein
VTGTRRIPVPAYPEDELALICHFLGVIGHNLPPAACAATNSPRYEVVDLIRPSFFVRAAYLVCGAARIHNVSEIRNISLSTNTRYKKIAVITPYATERSGGDADRVYGALKRPSI